MEWNDCSLFSLLRNGTGIVSLPYEEDELKSCKDLEVKRISDDFYTQGKEIQDLISIQFVKKVIDKIKEGNYIYKNE